MRQESETAPPARAEASIQAKGLLVYECTEATNEDLCLVPVAGGLERRVTRGSATDLSPRWMPDGRRVLFSSDRSGEYQLWTLDVGDGALARIHTSPARDWQSDPSADGRSIVYLSNAGGVEAMRMTTLDSASSKTILEHDRSVVLGNPDWSPDSLSVVFSSNAGHLGHHVFLADVATGRERRLSPLVAGACEPRFSPDGKKVAYVRRSHLTRRRSQIIEQDLATGKERVLVDWPALNYDPVYAPDQTELAFSSTIAGRYALYRLRLSDRSSWRVTFGAAARHPDYQPSP